MVYCLWLFDCSLLKILRMDMTNNPTATIGDKAIQMVMTYQDQTNCSQTKSQN